MSEFLQFAQVLEQKIRREIAHEEVSNPTPSPATNLDYAHLAWLLGQTPKMENRPQAKLFPYKRPAPKPRPSHNLNEEQRLALGLMNTYVCGLKDNCTKTELKRAFRQAALCTHPDRGGSAEAFQAVQKAMSSLSELFS